MSAIATGHDALIENLQKYFGFDAFKADQAAIIQSLLDGKDTFVIMPTGGGKSLCYQLPALMLPGTAIVISPLIALMKNQVDSIRGYSDEDEVAHFLNSSLTKAQMKKVKQDITDGRTKILYVAPETLTLMRSMVGNGEVDHLVAERVWQELAKGRWKTNLHGCSMSYANAVPWPACCRRSMRCSACRSALTIIRKSIAAFTH